MFIGVIWVLTHGHFCGVILGAVLKVSEPQPSHPCESVQQPNRLVQGETKRTTTISGVQIHIFAYVCVFRGYPFEVVQGERHRSTFLFGDTPTKQFRTLPF